MENQFFFIRVWTHLIKAPHYFNGFIVFEIIPVNIIKQFVAQADLISNHSFSEHPK